jgi:hypothetical protein
MAILPAIEGLEVQIHVDGQALKEYSSDEDFDSAPANHCIRYVEAATNKEFAIHMSTNQDYIWNSPVLHCHIELDGSYITSTILRPNKKVATVRSITEDGYIRTFLFSKINTSKSPATICYFLRLAIKCPSDSVGRGFL